METFGEAVRRLRGEESLRSLAQRAHVDPGHLSRVERGGRPPTAAMAAALDTALGANRALVALATRPTRPVWRIGDVTWRRQDAESLAAMLLTETPSPGNAAQLAHAWLLADPPQVYEIRAGRRIGIATVEQIERRVHQLRQLDDHVGGTETHTLVNAELDATAALLREASMSEEITHRLLAVIGELCQLAGWVSADAGRLVEARRFYLAGVHAAHAGGDAAGAANNLSTLAYLVANTGDRREAVTLARSAYRGAQRVATATTRALLLERVAWAHARAAEPALCERALGEVEDAYADHRPDDDPPWVYWLDPTEIEVMAGRCWTQLHRPLRAVPTLERSTNGYDDDRARERALYLTWLAEAYLQAHEVERAAETGRRALHLEMRSGSTRAAERVNVLADLLSGHRGLPAVDEFLDEIMSHRPGTA